MQATLEAQTTSSAQNSLPLSDLKIKFKSRANGKTWQQAVLHSFFSCFGYFSCLFSHWKLIALVCEYMLYAVMGWKIFIYSKV